MRDALDYLIEIAAPDEEDRLEIDTGVSFWRSSGSSPADGIQYQAEIPPGWHIGLGDAQMVTRLNGATFEFRGPTVQCFLLPETARCETSIAARSHWTSLGLMIAREAPMFAAITDKLPDQSAPQPATPLLITLLNGAISKAYRGVARDFALRAEAYVLLAAASAALSQDFASHTSQRISAAEAAMAILAAEYANPPRLPELARRVGTNRTYLARDFRERFGKSISAYIAGLRLDHADAMLAHGLPVSQVAARVGLTPSHFAQAYKRRFGYSPSQRSQP